jgi:anti-sigma regulatory factor (Ser/Thr protein kinase)
MEVVLTELCAQSIFPIGEPSQVAAARRASTDMARRFAFDETQVGRIAILVTEAATNILKHAGPGHGSILLRPVNRQAHIGLEIIALDTGPGIPNLGSSLRDGFSTTGTPGNGLGAMQRLAGQFDAYTTPGKGSVFWMMVWPGAHAPPTRHELAIGAVCLPLASEQVCGDSWHASARGGIVTVVVADGLGHGPQAHFASQAAIAALTQRDCPRPEQSIALAHEALKSTRGAALAAMQIDLDKGTLSFAGVGNISASINTPGSRRQMMSHNGIVGSNIRKIQEFCFPWTEDSILIAHSDGLGTHWDLQHYPDLQYRHPALIAAILYRDHARARDDATVVVLKTPLPVRAYS